MNNINQIPFSELVKLLEIVSKKEFLNPEATFVSQKIIEELAKRLKE